MTTLQDLRKRQFATIKAFGEAYGVSAGVASSILNGKHQMALSRADVQRIAALLEVSVAECIQAADASHQAHLSLPGDVNAWWRLENLWRDRERVEEEVNEWWARGGRGPLFTFEPLETLAVFKPLGLTANATEQDVKRAFRDRVKALADGKGGYQGDMDALVQVKEAALRHVRRA